MASPANIAPDELRLVADGAQWLGDALDPSTLTSLLAALADQPANVAGVRLFGVEALRPFLDRDGAIGAAANAFLPSSPRAVRAILFDKTPATNWSLDWHQDRVVAVRERVEVEGFGPWTRKHGALHVAPPFVVLAGMITLRVHLDPVPATNAPLLVAPGSHRIGRIPQTDVPGVVARCGAAACLAAPGDIWAYATPILHASERASEPGRRRVLQVDYAVGDLPGGLEWLGV
jgi:hypothetical protein